MTQVNQNCIVKINNNEMSTKKVTFVRPFLGKPLMSHVHLLEVAGWVGRVPPGLK